MGVLYNKRISDRIEGIFPASGSSPGFDVGDSAVRHQTIGSLHQKYLARGGHIAPKGKYTRIPPLRLLDQFDPRLKRLEASPLIAKTKLAVAGIAAYAVIAASQLMHTVASASHLVSTHVRSLSWKWLPPTYHVNRGVHLDWHKRTARVAILAAPLALLLLMVLLKGMLPEPPQRAPHTPHSGSSHAKHSAQAQASNTPSSTSPSPSSSGSTPANSSVNTTSAPAPSTSTPSPTAPTSTPTPIAPAPIAVVGGRGAGPTSPTNTSTQAPAPDTSTSSLLPTSPDPTSSLLAPINQTVPTTTVTIPSISVPSSPDKPILGTSGTSITLN